MCNRLGRALVVWDGMSIAHVAHVHALTAETWDDDGSALAHQLRQHQTGQRTGVDDDHATGHCHWRREPTETGADVKERQAFARHVHQLRASDSSLWRNPVVTLMY